MLLAQQSTLARPSLVRMRDQTQGFTLVHAETDVAHGMQRSGRQTQIDMQSFDFQ